MSDGDSVGELVAEAERVMLALCGDPLVEIAVRITRSDWPRGTVKYRARVDADRENHESVCSVFVPGDRGCADDHAGALRIVIAEMRVLVRGKLVVAAENLRLLAGAV